MVWAKGESGNLKGRPPGVLHTQADTADRLLKKYTGDEIRALASDPVRCSRELKAFEEMIIIQLANILNARDNNDNALERERLLDRVVGRPLQKVEQKISVSVEIESELLEGRRRVSKGSLPPVNYTVLEDSSVPDAILQSDAVDDDAVDYARARAVDNKKAVPGVEKRKRLTLNQHLIAREEREKANIIDSQINE